MLLPVRHGILVDLWRLSISNAQQKSPRGSDHLPRICLLTPLLFQIKNRSALSWLAVKHSGIQPLSRSTATICIDPHQDAWRSSFPRLAMVREASFPQRSTPGPCPLRSGCSKSEESRVGKEGVSTVKS